MYLSTSRPRRLAGGGPLERRVVRSRYAEQTQAARVSRKVEIHALDSERRDSEPLLESTSCT